VPTYALGELEHKIAVMRSNCEAIGRDPDSIVMSVEAVMALAPDDASLSKVREVAEKRFGGPGFGLHDGGLIGTPGTVIDRLNELRELGFRQVVLFLHDRASDETLEQLATTVLAEIAA
jgi:alkanesulfonate monooxygenase SsuD/methylene tetrahydromethanopterin reductase-like flavin-dependent oxidoreductase (luciferase family)